MPQSAKEWGGAPIIQPIAGVIAQLGSSEINISPSTKYIHITVAMEGESAHDPFLQAGFGANEAKGRDDAAKGHA